MVLWGISPVLTSPTMKAFLCISALAAAASAAPQFLGGHGLVGGHGVVGGHGLVGHGVAVAAPVAVARPVVHAAPVAVARPVVHAVAHPVTQAVGFNDLGEVSPYSYQYGVADELSGAAFQQTETDDGTGLRDGSYSVNLPDGRIQHVNYHADDANGYVAEVTYDGTAVYPDVAPVVGHAVAHPVAVSRPVAVAHPVAVSRPVAVAHPVATVARPVAVASHGIVGHGVGFGHGGALLG